MEREAVLHQRSTCLSDHPIPENLLTVRLMTRRYVTALLAHRERETIDRGLWAFTGFQQVARSQ